MNRAVVEVAAELAQLAPAPTTQARKRDDLLRGAITDARRQLTQAREQAPIFSARSTPDDVASDRAERQWRERNPGLSALVDHADGA